MRDINPEFSFPASSSSPRSAPNLPPAPIQSSRPLSYSPQPRPRRHAHRRSAAMSEDISAVEIAALTSPTAVPQLTLPQGTLPPVASQKPVPALVTPEGTPEGTPESTPQGAHRPTAAAPTPLMANEIPSSTGSPSSVKFIEPLAPGLSTPARSAKSKPSMLTKIPPALPAGTMPSMPSRPIESPRSFDSRSFDSRSLDARSLDARSFDTRPFDTRSFDTRSFDTRSVDSRSDFDRADRFDYSNAVLPKKPKQIGEPGDLVLNQSPKCPNKHVEPSKHSSSGRPSSDFATDGSTEILSDVKTEKRRKRRSFVQLFKRDSSTDSTPSKTPHASSSATQSKGERSKLRSPDSPLRVRSPPASPAGDETLVPTQQQQQPSRTPQSQYTVQFTSSPYTPSQRQPNLSAIPSGMWAPQSPISTPRTSGEMFRDTEPLPPTIDLDEALSCSFSHRQSDPVLESPFSKTSSAMGAVLEEEEDDERDGGGGGSETDSVGSRGSRSTQSRHRVSILQKTNSVSSNASSRKNQAPSSPRFVAVSNNAKQSGSQFGEPASGHSVSGHRSISYVGPIQPSLNFVPSPPRSPRLCFEQVSNLAISDPSLEPNPDHTPTAQKRMSMPQPQVSTPQQSGHKSGHRRRRSLIDRLMRR